MTALGDQSDRAFTPVANSQPAHLSCGESEPFGGACRLQISLHNRLNTLQSIQLLHAHCHPGQLPHHRSWSAQQMMTHSLDRNFLIFRAAGKTAASFA